MLHIRNKYLRRNCLVVQKAVHPYGKAVYICEQWRTEGGGLRGSTPPHPKFRSFTKSNQIAN
jgi:hypothetical protein